MIMKNDTMNEKRIGSYYNKKMFEKKICDRHHTKLKKYIDDEWGELWYCTECDNEFKFYEDGSYNVIS